MKKIILPGLVAGIALLVVGMLIGQVFQFVLPSLKTEYTNNSMFRPWADPLMSIYFLYPFALGLILAWIWTKVHGLFKGGFWQRGSHFGMKYWLVTIPGMIITYSTFQVSLPMVLSWTLTGLAQTIIAGIILARVSKA